MNATTDWDLVVVGAGPAGATAALAALHADPSLRVLLLDRSDFPRDKSCGDGIAPHCFEKLASIGVTGVEDGWTPLTRLELARGDAVGRRDDGPAGLRHPARGLRRPAGRAGRGPRRHVPPRADRLDRNRLERDDPG